MERLKEIADKLRNSEEVPPVTPREFLEWFGYQRRSYWNVWYIRRNLGDVGLITEPDFESVYLDSHIKFALRAEASQSEPAAPDEPDVTIPIAGQGVTVSGISSYAGPTYRMSKLAAANQPIVSVVPDASIGRIVTLMLTNDFSQLPVMTSDREVKGVVSWASIGTRLALGKNGQNASGLMDAHQEIRADASLFLAIPIIQEHQYVLVRGRDNRITGIVTASDLTVQFQQLAEPFLLLGEIENHIRRILVNRFSTADLASVRNPNDGDRAIKDVFDLTFGEYLRLLENNERWEKLNVSIDRAGFCEHLDKIRRIRNDVMHFDPDPMPDADLEQLRNFARFLDRLQSIGLQN